MKLSHSISYFAYGALIASIYKGKNHVAIEIGDQATSDAPSEKVGIFVDKRYEKHLICAIKAFNDAWQAVENANNPEHE